MAKLPPIGGQQQNGNNAAVDNLTKKVAEMRTNDAIRAPRHPGQTGFAARGGAPRGRGGPRHQETRKIEVPKDDFDFESSNAKFNKDDLVKEAIAGSPLGEHEEEEEVPLSASQPTVSYNKASSFFDDLSSEIKDRAEGGGGRPGGREWRGEEQRKNMETFGQGSVDNGSYRGGYRGRGRGRGRGGYRGRGNYGNGQAGARGGYRNPAQDSL
jgi:protein LSM14